MKQPKIHKALKYLESHPDATPYEAAKHAGLPATAVYQRVKLDKFKKLGLCPCCGQTLPKGQS